MTFTIYTAIRKWNNHCFKSGQALQDLFGAKKHYRLEKAWTYFGVVVSLYFHQQYTLKVRFSLYFSLNKF